MREKLVKLEKFLFYLLVLSFFVQKRLVWPVGGGGFNEWTSVYFYASDILLAALIFLWWRRAGEIQWRNFFKVDFFKQAEGPLFLFLIVAGLSLAVSQNRVLGFYGFIKLLEMAALFFYVKSNFDKLFNLEKFWQFFIAGAALQSIVALIQFFTQKSLGLKFLAESPLAPDLAGVAKITVAGQNFVRAYGLVPHPNVLAAILVAAIFGLAYLVIKNYAVSKIWQKIIYGVALVLNSAALFFTFSRAVTLIGFLLLIGWAAIIFLRQKNYRRPITIFIILLFIVHCSLFTVFRSYFFSRYDIANIGESQSLNLRVFYNGVALKFIKQNPFLGLGQGNFVWALEKIQASLPAWRFQPVHDIYLLIASEIGILGLLAFLWFLFLTIRGAWQKSNIFSCLPAEALAKAGLLLIVNCLLLIALFDHFLWDLQQGQIIFWLFLGLLVSVVQSGQRHCLDNSINKKLSL
jgi:O-antigen ligase